jgi:hypothetical protein
MSMVCGATVTTTGYSDRILATALGRVLAGTVMVGGIAVLAPSGRARCSLARGAGAHVRVPRRGDNRRGELAAAGG